MPLLAAMRRAAKTAHFPRPDVCGLHGQFIASLVAPHDPAFARADELDVLTRVGIVFKVVAKVDGDERVWLPLVYQELDIEATRPGVEAVASLCAWHVDLRTGYLLCRQPAGAEQ